jgi:hydrogenase/urease accessory protein HupE
MIRRRNLRQIVAGLLLAMAFVFSSAHAHEVRPAYLEIKETVPGQFSLLWRTPVPAGMRLPVALKLPDDVRNLKEPVVQELADSLVERRWIQADPKGFAGKHIEFPGLQLTITDVLVRYAMLDGREGTAIVRPAQPWLEIAAVQSWLGVAGTYVGQGVLHILFGVDHLLFVFGLLLIVKDRWMLLKTITAFTIAHSITLAIATLGFASAPVMPLNAVIALSILFSWTGNRPVMACRDQFHHPTPVGCRLRIRIDTRFRVCRRPDKCGAAWERSAVGAVEFQRWRRDRPGIVRAFNPAPGTLLPPIGNPLAPLGPGVAGIHRGIARGVLDDPAGGNAFGNHAMKHFQPPTMKDFPQRAGAARRSLVILFLLLYPLAAFAHQRGGEAIGFASGFEHPISGLDHILAMVAVGMWGAQLGAPAMWVLPVVFPMVMALGGMMGLMGIKLPGIELCIALSALALGFAVFREARPKLWIAAIIVGFFAIAHGHAHGTELPQGASGVLYSIGFVIATGLLHAFGIGIGLVHRWPAGRVALRVAGAVVAMGGVFFLWKVISGEAV